MAEVIDPVTQGIAARAKTEIELDSAAHGLGVEVVPETRGVIRVRGTVPSDAVKRAVIRAAWRVQGVAGVRDELVVDHAEKLAAD